MELTIGQIKELISKAEYAFHHQECATCEVYLGYLAQLEIDADPAGQQYLREYKPPREQVHGCLGCDPCPSAILHAEYLRKKKAGKI